MLDGNTAALNTYLDDQERLESERHEAFQEFEDNFDIENYEEDIVYKYMIGDHDAGIGLGKKIIAEMDLLLGVDSLDDIEQLDQETLAEFAADVLLIIKKDLKEYSRSSDVIEAIRDREFEKTQ